MPEIISPVAPPTVIGQWTLVLGFFMPMLIAVIQQSQWQRDFKTFVAFMVCVAAAAVQMIVEGRFSAAGFFPSVLALSALSTTFFHHFWKPLGLADKVEAATSSRTPREDVDAE